MFKHILFAISLLLPISAFALDEVSVISDDGAKLVKNVTDELGIINPSKKLQKSIYDSFEFALKDGWNSYWVGNGDLAASKFRDDKYRVFEYLISNNNRFSTISFVYFPQARQIYVTTREFVTGKSDLVLKAFKEKKATGKYKVLKETDNYGMLKAEGKVSFEDYHVSSDAGGVSYISYSILDVD